MKFWQGGAYIKELFEQTISTLPITVHDHCPADTNAGEWKLKNKDRNTLTVGECTFKLNTCMADMHGWHFYYIDT